MTADAAAHAGTQVGAAVAAALAAREQYEQRIREIVREELVAQSANLAIIKQLLALQIRLQIPLQGDREAAAQVEHDLLAIRRGDLEQVGVRQHGERPEFVDDGTQGLGGDGIAETPVGNSGHDSSPSLDGVDSLSVGESPRPDAEPASGAGHQAGDQT